MQARTETKTCMAARRERTRHLIELGGLVQKSGLVELTDDDRAVLLGGFLAVAQMPSGNDRRAALDSLAPKRKQAFSSCPPAKEGCATCADHSPRSSL